MARGIAWGVFWASLVAAFVLAGAWGVLFSIAWLGSIVALLAIRARAKLASGVPQKKDLNAWVVAALALVFAALDVFVFAQGAFALVLCIVGFLHYLPRAIGAYPDRALFRLRVTKAAATLGAGAAAIAAIVMFNLIAEDRAKEVIAAVEAYKAKSGRYPKQLGELVPAYLPEVPQAKPAGMMRAFTYYVSETDHTLMYTVVPPFGRKVYSFETQRWSALD